MRLHRFTAGALAFAFTLMFAAPPQILAQAAKPQATAASAGSSGWSNVNDQAKSQQLSKESSARTTGSQRYDSFQSNGGASRSQNNWGTSGSRPTSRPSGGGGARRR